jgi:hypothetical protein
MIRSPIPILLAAALAVVMVLPVPAAEAAYLKRFKVRDSGSRITWAVTVCTTGATSVRRFRTYLDPESGGITYWRSWDGGSTGPGCSRWTMRAKDIWLEQVWYSQLTVVMRNGQILRTPEKAFYID